MTLSTPAPDADSAPPVSLAQAALFGMCFMWLLYELDSRFPQQSTPDQPLGIILKPETVIPRSGGVIIDDWTGAGSSVLDGTAPGTN